MNERRRETLNEEISLSNSSAVVSAAAVDGAGGAASTAFFPVSAGVNPTSLGEEFLLLL